MASSSTHSCPTCIPNDHVRLILLQINDSTFYLDVPLSVVGSLCLKPRKYLVFLGWCILGVEGILARHDGEAIDTNGALGNREVYRYISGALDTDLSQAVDLDIIKTRTMTDSTTTDTCDHFRANLLKRDTCCAWTGVEPAYGVAGIHIIPHRRGSSWFELIVANRPKYGEKVEDLKNIDDVRNGIIGMVQIQSLFNVRRVVVLKTPNHILSTKDIPRQPDREPLYEDVSYPRSSRYTLQWLVTPAEALVPLIRNNMDAAFKKHTNEKKPSDLLLHYNYGAAAVKLWGHGENVLRSHAHLPHPPISVLAPSEPSRNRSTAIAKCDAGQSSGATGTAEAGKLEDEAPWDEDDIMLFFWGNTPAAKERHQKKVAEETERMEKWREGVARLH